MCPATVKVAWIGADTARPPGERPCSGAAQDDARRLAAARAAGRDVGDELQLGGTEAFALDITSPFDGTGPKTGTSPPASLMWSTQYLSSSTVSAGQRTPR